MRIVVIPVYCLWEGERVNGSETLRPERVSLKNVSSSCCVKNTGEHMLVQLNWENLLTFLWPRGACSWGCCCVHHGGLQATPGQGSALPETGVWSSMPSQSHPVQKNSKLYWNFPLLWIFFFLKNICCWFSLVLKFCRVEMLTCFHLSVPLSHFFSSQFWCLLQFAYQSDVHIGLDGDLIWSQCCLSAKQMCIKMCIRKRSKLGLLRNFFNLHKLHW